MRQKRDARGGQFHSSRARFFGIHRGLTSRREAARVDLTTRPTLPTSHPHSDLAPSSPRSDPTLAPPSHSTPRLHTPHPGFTLLTQNSACNSITLNFNIPRKRCNSNDHNSIFEIDPGELHARLLGNHALRPPPTQRGRDRRTRPRPRRGSGTNQTRKGSFLTSPSPFHHAPRPSVSPALVSGIRMRTSA